MSSISEIKIVGMDEDRPPRIRKEAYIDLHFKLSQKAPMDWCEDFNALSRRTTPPPKIDKNKGVCIDTYVNDMSDIAAQLETVKAIVTKCTEQYLEKIRLQQQALAESNADLRGQDGKQFQLNQIIEGLNFDN